MNNIKQAVEQKYNIHINTISAVRKMIGTIYKITTDCDTFILKLYAKKEEPLLRRSLHTMSVLKHSSILTPKIYYTVNNSLFFHYQDTQEYIGVLFDYIEGYPPSRTTNLNAIAELLDKLHQYMDHFPNLKKSSLGKEFYIDRFINLLVEKNYDQAKIDKLKAIAQKLFSSLYKYPLSFCHGDFHNENLIQTNDGQIYLIDFDASNYTNNIIDLSSITDHTNFNQLTKIDFNKTICYVKKFLEIYDPSSCKNYSIKDIISFIPLRHIELIATIAAVKGSDEISIAFLNQQYDWIMTFMEYLKNSHL